MIRIFARLGAVCLLASAGAAHAEYVASPTLLGGAQAFFNTASGALSLCYRANANAASRCETIATFQGAAGTTRIAAPPEGGQYFTLFDTAAGRVIRCDVITARIGPSSSGWSCVTVSARLP